MTNRTRRLAAPGTGFALALAAAAALGFSSHALAASAGQGVSSTPSAENATKTMQLANVQPSPVVNRDDSDALDAAISHHSPNLDGAGPLAPLVRHPYP